MNRIGLLGMLVALIVAGVASCTPRHVGGDIPEDVSESGDLGTSGTQPAHGPIPDR